jgi:Methyltransferase domain
MNEEDIFLPRSAWVGHEQFMDWLIGTKRPMKFVELGVHSGWSFFAACNAVKRFKTQTHCIGVDTFKGDDQTGFYSENIWHGVSTIQKTHFSGFSELWRMTFDEAADKVEGGTVDLLHIDGRHTYEDVKHDFETWEPKLFPGATVLFHDTQSYDGVKQFWNEIKTRYPHFEFEHAYGLGVLTYRPIA